MTSTVETENWNPWHAGERSMQQGLGVAQKMEKVGQLVIRDHMPDQHRDFFEELPLVVFASVDSQGDVWAGIASGNLGFIRSPDAKTLNIPINSDPNDPAHAGLVKGGAIGLLGIELAARRRNRMNGIIAQASADEITIQVEHSFGNCPKYIQQRDWVFHRDPADKLAIEAEKIALDDPQIRSIIERADTFFVGSYVDHAGGDKNGRQVDVSHRGGKPGFVRMGDDRLLTIPDFSGNLHFNTLGNFMQNPRAGLTFMDFETGDMLQLSGRAAIVLDSPEIAAFEGAERLWTFMPERAVLRRDVLPFSLKLQQSGQSPYNEPTGDWRAVEHAISEQKSRSNWQALKVAKVVQESASIRSFYLEAEDGRKLADFKAGQHLPIRLDIPDQSKPILRTYTLSSSPEDQHYRISVKREDGGAASRFLHDKIGVGDIIEARKPAGDFTLDTYSKRPIVLISAGVGITPMIAMLRQMIALNAGERSLRKIWFIHAAKAKSFRAFDDEIEQLTKATSASDVKIIRIVSEEEEDEYSTVQTGRISAKTMREALPLDLYDFYLCGPSGFMQNSYDILLKLGVNDQDIHAESFGPSSIKRNSCNSALEAGDVGSASKLSDQPSKRPVNVEFRASSKQANWQANDQTLLELAEDAGLSPEYSCRSGSCGSCAVKLLRGKVAYLNQTSAQIAEDEVLICSAVPASQGENENAPVVLDL